MILTVQSFIIIEQKIEYMVYYLDLRNFPPFMVGDTNSQLMPKVSSIIMSAMRPA